MTVAEQVARCMAYRSAHAFWLANKIAAVRAGRPFNDPKPRIEDYAS